jgi:hypothetical protein
MEKDNLFDSFDECVYNLLSQSEVITRDISFNKSYHLFYKRRFYDMDKRICQYIQFLISLSILELTGGNEYYGEKTYQLSKEEWKNKGVHRAAHFLMPGSESIEECFLGLKKQYRDINLNTLNI